MKKKWTLTALSLLAFTTAYAANNTYTDNAQMRNLENRVTALEQRKTAGGMINPQGRPQIRDGADLFVFADFLYWNAHENGLQVAVKNEGSGTNLSDSDAQTLKGKWNVGFRLGVGYNTPHDGWDLKFTWLRFTDNGSKNGHTHAPNYFLPTIIPPANVGLGNADSVKSHWRMRLDQLDLDLGREFFVSKWLTLRPHFGLRADWIRQTETADFEMVILTPVEMNDVGLKDRWYGIGLEGGLDTQWGLGSGWSLFGNVSTAILYGLHKITDVNRYQPTGLAEVTFMDFRDSRRISHPILDIEAGVRWDNMFSNDRFHLGLQIGWEHHVYFSQNQFPIFTSNASLGTYVNNQGDLTLQGWTFAARFDF